METDINKWIFEIPLQDIQNKRMPNIEAENSCICCGKEIKEPKQFVHLLTNGSIVSSDQPFDNDQGFFPIGNECKNRVPNNFYFNKI